MSFGDVLHITDSSDIFLRRMNHLRQKHYRPDLVIKVVSISSHDLPSCFREVIIDRFLHTKSSWPPGSNLLRTRSKNLNTALLPKQLGPNFQPGRYWSIKIIESIIKCVVSFAYSGSIQLTKSNVLHVLLIATNLKSAYLVESCVQFMLPR